MQYETDQILAYLAGQMNETERQSFEAVLATDTGLQERLETCRESLDFYRQQEADAPALEQLRQISADLNRQYFPAATQPIPARSPRRISFRPNLLRAAAALALLIFAGLYWFRSPDPLDDYGHLPVISNTERGAAQHNLELVQLINAHQYREALPLSRAQLAEDTGSITAKAYYGLCLLHTGAYAESRTWLQQVYRSGSLLQYRAALLIALGYYQEQNKEESRKWLSLIPPDAEEFDEARSLSEQLK